MEETRWAILELMGHRCLAGRVREVVRFGVPLCQIEISRGEGAEPLVQEYAGAAIFGLTWTDEATVQQVEARGQYAGPVTVGAFRRALPAPAEEWYAECDAPLCEFGCEQDRLDDETRAGHTEADALVAALEAALGPEPDYAEPKGPRLAGEADETDETELERPEIPF